MYIVYSSSDYYSMFTGISIISLCENNLEIKELDFFILDGGINDVNKNNLISIGRKYNRKINIINISNFLIDKQKEYKFPFHQGNLNTYASIFLPEILKLENGVVLMIDSDTIVRGPLQEIEMFNVNEAVLGAVENIDVYKNLKYFPNEEKKIVLKNKKYFNAGVLLIDIDNWIKYDIDELIREKISDLEEFTFYDQTILNYAIPTKHVEYLDYKYNFYSCENMKYENYEYKYFDKEMVDKAKSNPIIIHFKGFIARPWYKECVSFWKKDYDYYKSLSPWPYIEDEIIYDSKKYLSSSFIEKLTIRLNIFFHNNYFYYLIKLLRRKVK